MGNNQMNNNQNDNSLNDNQLFSNYNDAFTSNNNISFTNLVNMSVMPNNQIPIVNDNQQFTNEETNFFGDEININASSSKSSVNDDFVFFGDEIFQDDGNVTNNKNVVNVLNNKSNDKDKTKKNKYKRNNHGIFKAGKKINYRKEIGYFLSDMNVISTVLVLAFIFVCIVVAKAVYFENKVGEYEKFFVQIDEKMEEEAKVYAGQELSMDSLKKVAASELVNCIGTKLDIDNLSDGVKKAINDIRDYYNQSYNNFAFAYKDIYTGFTVTYNEKQDIFTASTIKAPTDIYIWEMASQGKIDLEKELTYMPYEYVAGSGMIQHNSKYSKYKTRELLRLSTVYSDNIAHNMLMDNYGRTNMLNFWKNLGTTAIFKQNSNWGNLNAHDALIYMSELYRFYNQNDEYGNQIMTNFLNAFPKFIKGKNGYKVANKSGWTGSAIHDVSIIFADNPYIIVALSNTGNGNYTSYFNKANDLAYNLHMEYWKYKMSLCDNIKQY